MLVMLKLESLSEKPDDIFAMIETVIADFLNNGPTDEEVDTARESLITQHKRCLEKNMGVASCYIDWIYHDVSLKKSLDYDLVITKESLSSAMQQIFKDRPVYKFRLVAAENTIDTAA